MFRKAAVFLLALALVAGAAPGQIASTVDSQSPLQGKTVILDPGHGLGNTNVYSGYDEQVAMLKLAQKIKPLLEARGATVHMTRSTKYDVPLHTRVAIVNKLALQTVKASRQAKLSELQEGEDTESLNADILEIDRLLKIVQSVIDKPTVYAPVYLNAPYSDKRKIHPDWQKVFDYENDPVVYNNFLMISLHSNAMPKPIKTSVNGVDVFIASASSYTSKYTNSQLSNYFGEQILNGINALGIKKNKVNISNLLMVRESNVPGVLVENGFHTNPSDRSKLLNNAFLDRLAVVYADNVTNYFAYVDAL